MVYSRSSGLFPRMRLTWKGCDMRSEDLKFQFSGIVADVEWGNLESSGRIPRTGLTWKGRDMNAENPKFQFSGRVEWGNYSPYRECNRFDAGVSQFE